jgi:DNA-binding response OmpR family regulator
VVLDLGWPESEGLAFCEEIGSLPTAVQPPVIALTDQPVDHWDVQAFSVGPQEFLTKPFHVADLLDRVARYLLPGE